MQALSPVTLPFASLQDPRLFESTLGFSSRVLELSVVQGLLSPSPRHARVLWAGTEGYLSLTLLLEELSTWVAGARGGWAGALGLGLPLKV